MFKKLTKGIKHKLTLCQNRNIIIILTTCQNEKKQEYTSDDIDYSNDNCSANKEMKDKNARPEIANDLSRGLEELK